MNDAPSNQLAQRSADTDRSRNSSKGEIESASTSCEIGDRRSGTGREPNVSSLHTLTRIKSVI